MNLLIDEMPTFIIESDYKSEDKYNDIELNRYYNYYEFICNKEQELLDTFNMCYEDILYSKYYWFSKLKNRYELVLHKDVGIDQYQYKILEEIELNVESVVDWELIQKLEKMV